MMEDGEVKSLAAALVGQLLLAAHPAGADAVLENAHRFANTSARVDILGTPLQEERGNHVMPDIGPWVADVPNAEILVPLAEATASTSQSSTIEVEPGLIWVIGSADSAASSELGALRSSVQASSNSELGISFTAAGITQADLYVELRVDESELGTEGAVLGSYADASAGLIFSLCRNTGEPTQPVDCVENELLAREPGHVVIDRVVGLAPGSYQLQIRTGPFTLAANGGFGFASAHWEIDATIPEPSPALLQLAALVALVGIGRRHNRARLPTSMVNWAS